MLDPVATVADLRAASGYVDKATIFCEAKGLFYYESTSAAVDDADLVVKPTAVTGNGRWLRISSLSPLHETEHATGGDDPLSDVPGGATLAGGATTITNVAARLPSVDEAAGLSGNTPTAVSPVQTLGQAERVVEVVITATEVAALGAVANGQVDFSAVLPVGALVTGAWIEKGTDFSGGAIATMTASIGVAAGVDVDRFTVLGDVFTGAGAGNLNGPGARFDGTETPIVEGAILPSVNFIATVATMDACTAGSLTAKLTYTIPQA